MRVSLDKNLMNTSEGVRLFEFDECPGVLNEDLLKAITGAGAAVLAIGLTKAVAAHNLMAIKKYMKTVVSLAINGKGKKWNEPSYKSITNDEKRNALMITYQLAKYAAIYDYSKDGSSMFNSYIEMPNIPGGSDKNFHELLKKKTKWFGLKTVSDPIKNIKSIKPESDQEPNPYFTSILEQYRNALSRVFGESEAKQITNAINSYKGKKIGDAKALKESLIKIFDNAISVTDMSKYTIFKDLDKALNALIDSYDKNIKEAISNNRTILDKKLKKDGLIALWGKYMNILRTNKQQFVDDFNKSPEYTYLRDFLRSTMISLLVSLLEKIGGSEEEEPEDKDIVDPVDPEPEDDDVDPEDDIIEDFSVRFEPIYKKRGASESYTFGELVNKLYEEEFGEEENSIDEVKLILESKSEKPLGKILCIVKSAEDGHQDEIIQSTKKDVSTDFIEQETDHLSFANLDNTEYPCYTNEGSENEKEWSTILNLSDLAESIAFNRESSPYLVCVAYPMDEDSNLLKDDLDKVQIAEWKYEAGDEPGPKPGPDPEDDDDIIDPEDDDPVNPEAKDLEVYINGNKMTTNPSDVDESTESGKIEASDDYGIRIVTSVESIKTVLLIFSSSPIRTYHDIAEAVKDKANKLVIRPFQSVMDKFECSYYVSQDEFEKNDWKYFTAVPRTETSNVMTSKTTEFDLSKEGYFSRTDEEEPKDEEDEDIVEPEDNVDPEPEDPVEPKNLPVVIPTGEITKSGEFRIDLNANKEIALNYTKCVVVLASSEDFFKSMTRDNELTFKANVDKVPYYRKDAFKVLASADNYTAVYINFGEDTTALRGIKFNPAFIEFKPGDEVWFKIYPVREVGGHLELNLEGASKVGSYKFSNESNAGTKLLTINPIGQLTKKNEFRIDLNVKDKNLANRFKMCVAILSSSHQFLESMTSENERAFKHNVDSIKYVQSDKFKILAMDKNYTVVLINFGNDTSTLTGIKFAPGFITFQPGDEIFFKIYPVSVENEHLVLQSDMASAIGMYKFEQPNVPQNVQALPGQKQLSSQQNQLPANNNTPTQE